MNGTTSISMKVTAPGEPMCVGIAGKHPPFNKPHYMRDSESGERCMAVILGPATKEDWIRQKGRQPHPRFTTFVWISMD